MELKILQSISNTECDTESITCGSQDNVQNYMDYSDCSSMFTEGQKTRMLAAMNSSVGGRNNIWSASNHNLVFIDTDTLPDHDDVFFTEDDLIELYLLSIQFQSNYV